MSRLIPVALAALVAAGCASATAGGPGAVDGAASLVPGNAVAFVAASTDLTSSQWHAVGKVLLTGLERKTKLVWSTDLEPAVGDELDVAVLPGNQIVALTQPHDEANLAALARKYNFKTRKVGDWTAIAQTDAVLNELGPSALSLAENKFFRAAMERTPSDALVRAYVSGAKANELLASLPGQMETSIAPLGVRYHFGNTQDKRPRAATIGVVDFRWAAVALTGEKGGLKLEAVARTGELTAPGPPRYIVQPSAPYVPALPDEIPADVLAVLDFPVPLGAFEQLEKLPPQLSKLFGKDAFGLPQQLDALLHGETALYVRAGLPIPELTLVTQPTDTAEASAALDDLLRALPKTGMLKDLTLHRAVIGGQFVVSTTQQGIDDFRGGGAKLSADPSFLEARKLSGMQERDDRIRLRQRQGCAAAAPARGREASGRPARSPDADRLRRRGRQRADVHRLPPGRNTQLAWARMSARSFSFTSESVTEGHPDKIADQISDSVLDAVLAEDPQGRVACETLITTGLVVVAGEITTETYVDIPRLVRERIREIGYTRAKYGFDAETCGVDRRARRAVARHRAGRRPFVRGAARRRTIRSTRSAPATRE